MKVMIVHNRYRSASPSGENRVVDQESSALAAAGHQVTHFERRSDDIAGWPLAKKAVVPAKTVWSREVRDDLSAKLRETRPDIVHIHNTFPLLSSSVLYACRDEGIPVVVTIHNYRLACTSGDFYRRGAVCHDCVRGPLIQGVIHSCYRGSRAASIPATVAISTSRSAWRTLVSAYIFISASQRDLLSPLGFAQDRVFVAHNLVPHPTAKAEPGRDCVLYAGRLEETKGLRVLMTAWDRYRHLSPDASLRLVIVGAGTLTCELAAWASQRPSVELLGQVSGERCAELIGQARAVLIPSAWEETFGLVAVEAMALGVPAIASGHGSFTELIDHGVDGVLFRPNDPTALAVAIADVAANPDRYIAYGKLARRSYEQRFDPDERLRRMIEIYRFAIANPVSR